MVLRLTRLVGRALVGLAAVVGTPIVVGLVTVVGVARVEVERRSSAVRWRRNPRRLEGAVAVKVAAVGTGARGRGHAACRGTTDSLVDRAAGLGDEATSKTVASGAAWRLRRCSGDARFVGAAVEVGVGVGGPEDGRAEVAAARSWTPATSSATPVNDEGTA